jgi:hypothetical protein
VESRRPRRADKRTYRHGLNRLTEKAQGVIRGAPALAQRHGHAQMDIEHLAAARLGGGVAARQITDHTNQLEA